MASRFRRSVTGSDTRRGKHVVHYESEFDGPLATTLESKLDVGPPPWLPPAARSWVRVPVHDRYRGSLPRLPVVDLAENVAEKIARLNRATLARDAYDLVWIKRTAGLDLNRPLIRRLAVLKIWVDLNGLSTQLHTWIRQPGARPFDVERWLVPRRRREFDDENIGLLTMPPPDLDDLGRELAESYTWLTDLDAEESVVAQGREQDRGLVLRMLGALPANRVLGAVR
jgi:Nucleotidyl transferase AbiEii toxin, Type IV TA system